MEQKSDSIFGSSSLSLPSSSSSVKKKEFHESSDEESEQEKEKEQEEQEQSQESALNEYYKLKNKYELEIMKNKRKILNNITLSRKEKRQEYLKLKPKCVNCKRPNGTIFSVKFFQNSNGSDDNKQQTKEQYREFRARCGNIADPCNLNITIQTGIYNLLPNIINKIENEIKESKDIIIDNKNKLLFGYITTETALQDFDDEKVIVETYTSLLEEYLNEYINITDNEKKNMELKESIQQSYDFIEQIKESIRSYNETGNTQFVKDLVNMYITKLKPLLQKIMALKYKQSFVYYDEQTNTFHLMQNKNTVKSIEYTSFVDKVVAFDVGDTGIANKKRLKGQNMAISKFEMSPQEDKFVLKPTIVPDAKIIGEEPTYNNGEWNLPEYNILWNKMPIKLKTVLTSNPDWMTQFMINCVNSRAKRENCKFTPPSELKLPPQKISVDNYDFGVQIYTDEFNKLPKGLKETYLTLYSMKDGAKNYSLLLNSMNQLVAKSVDFNNGFL